MAGPESFGERFGDEDPDAKIGDFQVYGGAPLDRQQLQNGDHPETDTIEAELQEILRRGADE